MYRRVREQIITAEIMKLERRQAGERAARQARSARAPAAEPHGPRARRQTG